MPYAVTALPLGAPSPSPSSRGAQARVRIIGAVSVPLLDRRDPREGLRHVGADGDRRDADDGLASGVGGVLTLVGRTAASLAHLHDGGCGSGGGGPGLRARLALLSLVGP